MSGLPAATGEERTAPALGTPSSICTSKAIATLSGRFAEHRMMLVKPPSTATGAAAPSPVCTPRSPLKALVGCCGPAPETNPERRRCSHHRQVSGVAATAVAGHASLYVPTSTRLLSPAITAAPQRDAPPSSPGVAR